MSNFIHPAFDPVAGVVRDATWIDDYFGPHKYGVQFDAGGPVYRPDQAEVAAAGECIAALRSKLAAAEAEIELLKKQVIGLAEMQAEEWEHIECDACAPLRTRAEAAEASVAQMMEALEPFAEVADVFDADGRDMADEVGIYANTAGDYRRARAALSTSPSDYRERVRREAFEDAAKVADDFEARWDAQWRAEHKGSSHLEGKSDGAGEIASAIRALGDSNANG